MAEHVHLDPVGGVAGDMFAAAMLDAFPELAAATLAACRAAGLPAGWSVRVEPAVSHGLAASRFVVERGPGDPRPHEAVSYARFDQRLARAPLDAPSVERARRILRHLAQAEAAVHRVPVEQVHFHELGDWDTLVDVVAAAHLATACGARTWSCGPLPLGGGRVRSAHGWLPVPAPATARLLEGFTLVDDGIDGERVTPTGAAILRELVGPGGGATAGGASGGAARALLAVGQGAGTRELPGTPNVVRVLAFGPAADAGVEADLVLVAELEVDDQAPEDLAIGLEHLRADPGVLDVATFAGTGKKGRMTFAVRVLARPEAREAVLRACLEETRSLGVRWRLERRARLPRREVTIGADPAHGRVKLARRGTRTTAKADADAVARVRGFAQREAARREREEAALRGEPEAREEGDG